MMTSMNKPFDAASFRRSLRRQTNIFVGLTIIFWGFATFFNHFEAYPVAMWSAYAVALLFIAFGFIIICRAVRLRLKEGKPRLATALAVFAAILFFSIGGPVFLAWLAFKKTLPVQI